MPTSSSSSTVDDTEASTTQTLASSSSSTTSHLEDGTDTDWDTFNQNLPPRELKDMRYGFIDALMHELRSEIVGVRSRQDPDQDTPPATFLVFQRGPPFAITPLTQTEPMQGWGDWDIGGEVIFEQWPEGVPLSPPSVPVLPAIILANRGHFRLEWPVAENVTALPSEVCDSSEVKDVPGRVYWKQLDENAGNPIEGHSQANLLANNGVISGRSWYGNPERGDD